MKLNILIQIILIFFISISTLNAKYIQIEDEDIVTFPYEPFNFEIQLNNDNLTIREILLLIEEITNLKIFDHVGLNGQNIINDSSSYRTVGGILSRILKDYNGIAYIDKYIIHLDMFESTKLKLPFNWDIQKTAHKFKKHYPFVDFYIEGFNLKAFGDKLQVKEIEEKFKMLNKIFEQKISIVAEIYPYKTSSSKHVYLAHRNSKVEKQKPIKKISSKLGHGDEILIIMNENDVFKFMFDLQKRNLVLNKSAKISIKDISKAGIVIKKSESEDKENNFIDLDISLGKDYNAYMIVFRETPSIL